MERLRNPVTNFITVGITYQYPDSIKIQIVLCRRHITVAPALYTSYTKQSLETVELRFKVHWQRRSQFRSLHGNSYSTQNNIRFFLAEVHLLPKIAMEFSTL